MNTQAPTANFEAKQAHRRLFAAWKSVGLSGRAANALVLIGAKTVADIQEAGPATLLALDNVGHTSVYEIGRLIGGWKTEPPKVRATKISRLIQLQQRAAEARSVQR
jgi:hypothetical protein